MTATHHTPRTLTALLLFVATLLVACVSCVPTVSPCQRLTIGSDYSTRGRGEALTIRMEGPTFAEKRSNIQYDIYGQVIAFEFDFMGGSSSEHFVGNAKMERDISGRITSYKVLINGTTCTWP